MNETARGMVSKTKTMSVPGLTATGEVTMRDGPHSSTSLFLLHPAKKDTLKSPKLYVKDIMRS